MIQLVIMNTYEYNVSFVKYKQTIQYLNVINDILMEIDRKN